MPCKKRSLQYGERTGCVCRRCEMPFLMRKRIKRNAESGSQHTRSLTAGQKTRHIRSLHPARSGGNGNGVRTCSDPFNQFFKQLRQGTRVMKKCVTLPQPLRVFGNRQQFSDIFAYPIAERRC